MSAHTPGPWTADWDDSGQWYVDIGGLSISGTALRGDSGECIESANAHLIAAAPEMLDALRRVASEHQIREVGRLKGDRIIIPFDVLEQVRAAIAKAEGK